MNTQNTPLTEMEFREIISHLGRVTDIFRKAEALTGKETSISKQVASLKLEIERLSSKPSLDSHSVSFSPFPQNSTICVLTRGT